MVAKRANEVIDLMSDSDEDVDEDNTMPSQKVHDPGNDPFEEEAPCCPVSEEDYEEKGPRQPVVLPACGHTFSRETVESLFKINKSKKILCPLCSKQQSVRKIDGCPPNWDTISTVMRLCEKKKKLAAMKQITVVPKRIKKVAVRKPSQKESVGAAAPAVAAAGPSNTGLKRKKTRSQGPVGKLSGEVAKGKVTKRKKTKGPCCLSPLLEKIGNSEFEERAVGVLGNAHKQRRS